MASGAICRIDRSNMAAPGSFTETPKTLADGDVHTGSRAVRWRRKDCRGWAVKTSSRSQWNDRYAQIAVVPRLRKRCGFRRLRCRGEPLRVGLQNRKPRYGDTGPDLRPARRSCRARHRGKRLPAPPRTWRSKSNSLSVSADCFRKSQTHQCSLSQIAENRGSRRSYIYTFRRRSTKQGCREGRFLW